MSIKVGRGQRAGQTGKLGDVLAERVKKKKSRERE